MTFNKVVFDIETTMTADKIWCIVCKHVPKPPPLGARFCFHFCFHSLAHTLKTHLKTAPGPPKSIKSKPADIKNTKNQRKTIA